MIGKHNFIGLVCTSFSRKLNSVSAEKELTPPYFTKNLLSFSALLSGKPHTSVRQSPKINEFIMFFYIKISCCWSREKSENPSKTCQKSSFFSHANT